MTRVLITGSNRGIGLALVRRYLAAGNLVFATCRSPEAARSLRALREAHADRIRILRLDLVDPGSHEQVRRDLERAPGAIDVLINNAGVYTSDPVLGPERHHNAIRRFDAARALEFFRINSVAQLAVTRALLPVLEKGERPRIAFITSGMGSIGGKEPGEVEYSYSASKAALNMFARVLANDLAPTGVCVVTLDPGWVRTDMGTRAAPLEPDVVADGLYGVIGSLDATASGSFLNWRGEAVAW